jgi:bis(5'-nucleosidyl)-tetraphosphatase
MADTILSAGVVVVRRESDEWRVLLLRVYNYWDCPKGVVEPSEDPLVAARREAREEAGIEHLDFLRGEEFIETAPYSRNKIARYYLAATDQAEIKLPVSEALGRAEHQEFRWVSFEQSRLLTGPRVAAVLAWAHGRLMSSA